MNPCFAGGSSTYFNAITIVSTFWQIFHKIRQMKSYKVKSAILDNMGLLRGFFIPFGPQEALRVFETKTFLHCTTKNMKIQLDTKFQRAPMRGLSQNQIWTNR